MFQREIQFQPNILCNISFSSSVNEYNMKCYNPAVEFTVAGFLCNWRKPDFLSLSLSLSSISYSMCILCVLLCYYLWSYSGILVILLDSHAAFWFNNKTLQEKAVFILESLWLKSSYIMTSIWVTVTKIGDLNIVFFPATFNEVPEQILLMTVIRIL